MSELDPWVLPLIGYVLGVLIRVIVPYVFAYLQDGVKFDWKFVTGQALAALLGLIGLFATSSFIPSLVEGGFFLALFAGFGAASFGRETQKVVQTAGENK